jgi:predicted peroxiredoxin
VWVDEIHRPTRADREEGRMARLLVHIATGPENPTRVALGLLVARTALGAGHAVDVFVAGDGVAALRPATLDAGQGIGTGPFREHIDALVAGGATLYASGMSSKARGIAVDDLGGLPVTLAPPDKLVDLIVAADRVVTY